MGKGNTWGYGASKYGASKYNDGYREGMKDGFNTVNKLFKAPSEGGYMKEELCNIFDIKPGNIRKETVILKILDEYDIFYIQAKLDNYDETHVCRSCIHKWVCKLKPLRTYDHIVDTDIASMYPTKEWCEHFYSYRKIEKQEEE